MNHGITPTLNTPAPDPDGNPVRGALVLSRMVKSSCVRNCFKTETRLKITWLVLIKTMSSTAKVSLIDNLVVDCGGPKRGEGAMTEDRTVALGTFLKT